jgi:3',5'-cyclic AMP phosphodiesterase CpdA
MAISRRDFLKGMGAIALGGALGLPAKAVPASQRKRALRVAHLTDIHLQPEGVAVEGTITCLKALHESPERPDLILTGGDAVMDVFAQKAERARTLKSLWRKVWEENCKIPSRHCIGNHDVWGWNKSRSGCTGEEPDYGKKWATELFGIEKPYYAFTQAGWKFIVLDSTFPEGEGYKARLDDEQFEWLQAELQRTPATTHVLVLSHMPILSVCAYIDGNNEKTGNWVIPGDWVHIDARRIVNLFHRHPNVKLY